MKNSNPSRSEEFGARPSWRGQAGGAGVAFKETSRLMEEIDEVIEAHGGWPIE